MHYSGTLSCVLDWDRINLENYYSLYITKQIKTERTIKPAVITNMTSVLVRPKIIVVTIRIVAWSDVNSVAGKYSLV